MNRCVTLVLLLIQVVMMKGQVFPVLEFQRFYGKYGDDIPIKIIKSSDGNLLIGGNTLVQTAEGAMQTNIWILKVDTLGGVIWEQEVAMKGAQELRDMVATYEGGVAFAGVTTSMIDHPEKGDKSYWGDYFIGYLTQEGKIDWTQSYGGGRMDQAYAISRGLYREYMIVGSSHSGEGDVNRNFGMSDVWMLKIDTKGNKRFSKVMGGSRNDWATALITCKNGDYLLAGFTNSKDIDTRPISLYGNGLIIRMDKAGKTLWTQTFPCQEGGYFSDIVEDKNGRLILAGTRNKPGEGAQFWLLKLTADGKKISEQEFGSRQDDHLTSVAVSHEGGYLMGGYTTGNITGQYAKGGDDFWLIRVSEKGNIIWRNTYGGPNDERCRDVLSYSPGVVYAIGEKHNDFYNDDTPQKGKDFWLVRINEKPCDSIQASIFVRAKNFQAMRNSRIRFKARHTYGEKFHWDFGDGTESTEKNPLKSFSLPGMYEITLTVMNNEGCTRKVVMEDLLEVY